MTFILSWKLSFTIIVFSLINLYELNEYITLRDFAEVSKLILTLLFVMGDWHGNGNNAWICIKTIFAFYNLK